VTFSSRGNFTHNLCGPEAGVAGGGDQMTQKLKVLPALIGILQIKANRASIGNVCNLTDSSEVATTNITL
jgi:hypothetical protein